MDANKIEMLKEYWGPRIDKQKLTVRRVAARAKISIEEAHEVFKALGRYPVTKADNQVDESDEPQKGSDTSPKDLLSSHGMEGWQVDKAIVNHWGDQQQIKVWASKPVATLLEGFEALLKANPLKAREVTQRSQKDPTFDYSLIFGLADLHLGKLGVVSEVGEGYDIDIARNRLLEATDSILGISDNFGPPEALHLVLAGDILHIDNANSSTTKGTPQDTTTTPANILQSGVELLGEWVDELRGTCNNVNIHLVAGNHDRLLSKAVRMILAAQYKHVAGVTVHESALPRQHFMAHGNLFYVAHGDGAAEKKSDSLALLAASECPEWSGAKHRYLFSGHKHHEKALGGIGYTHYQLPSLSGADRWHASAGYQHARKALQAFVVTSGGVEAILYG